MSIIHCHACDNDYDSDFHEGCPRECEHVSWCAVHNAPAFTPGECDCGAGTERGGVSERGLIIIGKDGGFRLTETEARTAGLWIEPSAECAVTLDELEADRVNAALARDLGGER